MNVRTMDKQDLKAAALIHSECFPRQRSSFEWISCSMKAFPRTLCFVVYDESQIFGYVIWAQKSGFRSEVVIELEQIAVSPNHQGHGFGTQLIRKSLVLVNSQLNSMGSELKHVIVSTRADNNAQQLYRNILGAKLEATITNLYSADEVYMVARNITDSIDLEVK